MRYLHDEPHYVDLYDLLTIRECLRTIEFFKKSYQEKKKDKKISQEDFLKAHNMALNFDLYIKTTEDYRRKKETIQEWMDRDRKLQNIFDTTPEPENIRCQNCGDKMHSTIKHLEDYMDKPVRVLFFFECSYCKKRRGIYEDGTEHIFNPEL